MSGYCLDKCTWPVLINGYFWDNVWYQFWGARLGNVRQTTKQEEKGRGSPPPPMLRWNSKLATIAILFLLLLSGAGTARAEAALFLEEPFGAFGHMNPTGHAAVYLSRVCAESPTVLRACEPGETGVVISRYRRVGGYDWVAIPLNSADPISLCR